MSPRVRTAGVLGALSALGAVAIVPYLMVLQPDAFAELPLPLPAVLAVQAVQGTLLFTLLAYVGLRAGGTTLAGAPLLTSRLDGGPARPVPWRDLGLLLLAGTGFGFGIAALDPVFGLAAPEVATPAAWRGLLASLYGAVSEEVQLRVFGMGVLTWLLRRVVPKGDVAPWLAIGLTAVLFGVGHLPAAFSIWEPSAAVVARTLVLNGLLAVPFGWLYWKRGFLHAAAAHGGADLALHVVLPLVGG